MNASLPAYYTDLRPFRRLFATGLPILTYHKLGPRPRHARLKGLYLGERLFSRQLRELHHAGYASGSLDQACQPDGPLKMSDTGRARLLPSPVVPMATVPSEARQEPRPTKRDVPKQAASAVEGRVVVLTFDDGFVSVLEHGLKPLAQYGFQAIQFLVADSLGKSNVWDLASGEVPAPLMDAAQVREWLAAGHRIGSHTLAHPYLTRIPTPQAREEIAASRKKLEDTFGLAVDHFCYPYGDWNEAVRDLVAEAGYRTACTTEHGVNPPGTHPLSLRRITARYRSRNWKNFKLWLAGIFSK